MSVDASFNSMLAKYGHDVELVRLNPAATVSLKCARSTVNKEDPLFAEVSQETVLIKIRTMDLAGTPFASDPPKKLDRIKEDGSYLTVTHAAPMYSSQNIIGWNLYTTGKHA